MSKRYFVTRHRGAVSWAAGNGVRARKVEMENFDPAVVAPGDVVMGTLPVHIAAEVNRRGGHYWHLTMEVPIEWRGRELSAEQMQSFGACLREFGVQDLGHRVSTEAEPLDDPQDDDRTQVCIASAQLLPSVLPLLTLPWRRLMVYASEDMRGRAEHLERVLTGPLGLLGKGSGRECRIVPMPKRMDWESLRGFAREQAQVCLGHGPLDFNLTGGNKLMSLAFADAFRSQARLFYCSTDAGTLEVLDAVSQAPTPLAADRLDLASFLAVQGYEVVRSQRGEPPAVVERIRRRAALTARMVLSAAGLEKQSWNVQGRELCLADTEANLQQVRAIDKPSGNVLGAVHQLAAEARPASAKGKAKARPFRPWAMVTDVRPQDGWQALLEAWAEAGLIAEHHLDADPRGTHCASFRLRDEDAAVYLSGGYLEEYVWLALDGVGLPPTHFDANLGVGPVGHLRTRAKSSRELNELDAAALWNNRLLIIECKAGGQLTGPESQAIIHKLDQLKDNVGGTLGEGWVVASRPLSESTNADLLQRADLNRLRVVHGVSELALLGARLAKALGHPNERPWPGALLTQLKDFSGQPLRRG
jgi:CRISPR-associated protein Csx16